MQPLETNPNNGVDLTIHLDQADAEILFLLAIDSGQSLEDVLLGMMEEMTTDLAMSETRQPKVQQAIAEYQRTSQFDPDKWHE